MKYLKKTAVALMAIAAVLIVGCSTLSQVANLVNCKFYLASVSNVTWADINLSNIHGVSDLSVSNMQKAVNAIKNRDFTVKASVNVNVKNETPRVAKLFAFDYDLFLDDSFIASGKNQDKTYIINPNSTLTVPVPISADLVSIVKNGQVGDIINFTKNLMDYGNGKPSKVKVKLTPYAGTKENSLKLPTITLNKEFQ